MGHPQPPTEITTNNETAAGIVKQTIRQNKSRAMNMRYFWVLDQDKEGIINVRWKPGHVNKANYFTKHFFGTYHKKIRPIYLHEANSPRYIQNLPNPNKQDSAQQADFCEGVLKPPSHPYQNSSYVSLFLARLTQHFKTRNPKLRTQ